MSHPMMFDEDDPYLARVRTVALALPGAAEKVSHGRPAFFTKKVFAYYGGSVRRDGEWEQHDHAVLVLGDDPIALERHPHAWLPAYLAPAGWVGVDLHQGTDWREIEELLDASYRMTAPRRLVAELDARR